MHVSMLKGRRGAWGPTVLAAGLAAAASLFASSAVGQIVPGGTPSQIPPPAPVNDVRLKVAARFCEHFRAGTVGTALLELGDLEKLFVAMFGQEDWEASTDAEKAEVTKLYVEAMNLGHERGPGQTPDPVQPGDMSITDSNTTTRPATSRVGITFRTRSSPVRFVLRMEQLEGAPDDDRSGGWRIVDGYAVGDDSWVANIRKPYQALRGTSTPVDFMRQVHEAMRNAARAQRAATRPAR